DNDGKLSSPVTNLIEVSPQDSSAPFIQIGTADNVLTNISNFNLPVTVFDQSIVTTTVWHNGFIVYSTQDTSFDYQVQLYEGVNLLLVESIDSANNHASVTLSNIILDTTPPLLATLSPANGEVVYNTSIFHIQGTSNESLSSAFINNENLSIVSGKSFSYNV